MARQQSKVQANSFVGGFVSEASPLSFPEESALDIDNLDINLNGSVRRRKHFDYELDHQYVEPGLEGFTIQEQLDAEVYTWRTASGDSNSNFVVVKAAEFISIFEEGDSVSSNKKVFEIDLLDHAVGVATDLDVRNNKVDVVSGRGYMFIASKYIEPLIVEYDVGTDTFSVEEIDIRIRDLDGVDDGLRVNERPTSLSDAHRYNLENQGWNSSRISTYFNSRGRYPSNADIWYAGKDADNRFSPVQMDRVDFGNTPAPKGRKIVDVFDTTEGTPVDNQVAIVAVDFDTDTIYTDSAHGIEAGQEIEITNNSIDCDGTLVSYDGTYTVISVPTSHSFTIEASVTCAATEENIEIIDGGIVEYTTLEVNVPGDITAYRPAAISFYSGRIWYAGIEGSFVADNVYFSQIVTDKNKASRCHQEADPTSEEISDLLDNDGGVIAVAGMGRVARMYPSKGSLVIFSSNGVWEIRGDGESYFTATGYNTRKITSVPCRSPKSIIDIEGTLFFWAEDGIYAITENEVSGFLQADSLSDSVIKSFYQNISESCRRNAVGVYDYRERKIYWWYQEEPIGCGKFLNKALVFDLSLGCFYKYTTAEGFSGLRIHGGATIRNTSSGVPGAKYITLVNNGYEFIELSKEHEFFDLEFDEIPAYLITGHATLDDIGVKKSARQIIMHFLRTETGFEEDGNGGLQPVNPSGCKVRMAWDFTNDPVSNKWSPEFQGYRYRQLYLPSGPDDTFNTGYEVITTKTKLRGTGRAMSMHLRSEEGKDLVLLGWSIAGDAEQHE